MDAPKRQYKRTTIITAGLFAFLAGLGLAKFDYAISNEIIVLSWLIFLVTFARLRLLGLYATILLGLVLGIWRGQTVLVQLQSMLALSGVKTTALVRADSDANYNDRGQLSFEASQLRLMNDPSRVLPGKLTISGFGAPAVFRGDKVQITGKFYRTRGSKQLGMSFANMQIVGKGGSRIDDLRREFAAGLASSVPEPQASFSMGLLIGQRTTLPQETSDQLSIVGLTHIIAVSGYNLTIIIRGVRRLLKRFSKYQTTLLSVVLIVTFLLMTGMSASIVRASIVSGLSIAAWYYGRAFKPLLLLALTAVITAGWNPLYLWSDIGWYLSFFAFFGVMILSPLINQRFFKSTEPRPIAALMSESLCALLMTIPLVLFIFNQVSLVALLANLIIVPFVPLAMLLSLIAGLAGMFVPVLAGIIAWPASIIMTFMLDVVSLLARIPHALVQRSISLDTMLVFYACLLIFALILWKKVAQTAKLTETKMEF